MQLRRFGGALWDWRRLQSPGCLAPAPELLPGPGAVWSFPSAHTGPQEGFSAWIRCAEPQCCVGQPDIPPQPCPNPAGRVVGIQEELSVSRPSSALGRAAETLPGERGSPSGSFQEGQGQLYPAGTPQWVHISSTQLQFIPDLLSLLPLTWLSQPRPCSDGATTLHRDTRPSTAPVGWGQPWGHGSGQG